MLLINAANAQCPLTDAACTGTALLATDGNKTIPTGTTYYIPAGTTYTGNIVFATGTSKLCIEGTWTGKVVDLNSIPTGGTIDNYGTITNNTDWAISGNGPLVLNNHIGGTVTLASFTTSGGTVTFTNCGDMNFTGATGISSSGGTFTINNYASINITNNFGSTQSGFTWNNYGGSQLYVGGSYTFSAGTFLNNGNLCVKVTTTFSGGTFTNNNCFRTTSYDVSGSGAFNNNNYMKVTGNYTNSGTNNTNNGTLEITGNFTNSGTFIYGAGSLLTCVDWTSSATSQGVSGCAQIRATGVTTNSGNFVSNALSNFIYFYDSGTPAGGFDSQSGTLYSLHVNNNTCTPTSYPACTMAGSACTTVLPIELVEFKASCNNGKMDIFWTTASETNNDFFTIERTRDGNTFDVIGIIDSKAQGGNSTQTLSYSFTDNSFPIEEAANLNKLFYYRLKQTDFDGKYTYSFISPASCSNYCISDITVLSDNNNISLNIPSICSTFIDFSIYNALGQIVSTKREYIEAGNNIIHLDANNMSVGLYIIKASTISQTIQKKFGKQQ